MLAQNVVMSHELAQPETLPHVLHTLDHSNKEGRDLYGCIQGSIYKHVHATMLFLVMKLKSLLQNHEGIHCLCQTVHGVRFTHELKLY